nr:MAG TPA: hypothetical protein [Caudoviricetes sp.]
MKNKKAYIHNLKKEEKTNKGSLRKNLEQFEHDNKQIEQLVRGLSKEKFNLLEKPGDYDGSFGHDFFSMMYATLFIDILKNLRKELKCTAGDLDLKLGYTTGYPMSSFINTSNKPTKKNVKISSKIFERMCILFPAETKQAKNQNGIDKFINVNEILERALLIHGFNESVNDIKKYENRNNSESEHEPLEETGSQTKFELVIGETIIQFDEDATALDILKKIKKQTDLEFDVYETLKEKVI